LFKLCKNCSGTQYKFGTYGTNIKNRQLLLNNFPCFWIIIIRHELGFNGSFKWVLKKNITNKPMIFERKIMRKIFGPAGTDDGY